MNENITMQYSKETDFNSLVVFQYTILLRNNFFLSKTFHI